VLWATDRHTPFSPSSTWTENVILHCQLFYFHDSLAHKTPFASATFQAIRLRPLTLETGVRSQAILCEICGIVAEGQVCLSTSVFFHQYHSSNDTSIFVLLSQMSHNLSETQHHQITYLEIHFLLGHHAKRANVAVRCTLVIEAEIFLFFGRLPVLPGP